MFYSKKLQKNINDISIDSKNNSTYSNNNSLKYNGSNIHYDSIQYLMIPIIHKI